MDSNNASLRKEDSLNEEAMDAAFPGHRLELIAMILKTISTGKRLVFDIQAIFI